MLYMYVFYMLTLFIIFSYKLSYNNSYFSDHMNALYMSV